MDRLLQVAGLAAVAMAVAALLRARAGTEPPTRPNRGLPDHLDRTDFHRPGAPWLVAVFSSPTCRACEGTWLKAKALISDDVAVQDIDSVALAALHERYGIDAVPLILVAGPDGTVRASFVGEPSTADLWAALDRVRAEG